MALVNKARGEAALTLDGVTYRLCLTLGALAEIEAALGVETLGALDTRLKAFDACSGRCVRSGGSGARPGRFGAGNRLGGSGRAAGASLWRRWLGFALGPCGLSAETFWRLSRVEWDFPWERGVERAWRTRHRRDIGVQRARDDHQPRGPRQRSELQLDGRFDAARARFVPNTAGTVLPNAATRPTIVFNVQTPDARSFQHSETQIGAMLARLAVRGQRNL
jgi:hypothetical protein